MGESKPLSIQKMTTEEPMAESETSPGHAFGTAAFSLKEKSAIGEKLCKPLERGEVCGKSGPGGKRVYYLEGWRVIHEANRIFGYEGWSQSIVKSCLHFCDLQEDGRYAVCVTAIVRVTLRDGTTREDRGGGTQAWSFSKGDAIVAAEKEAVTDATKRALKSFGPRFGLCLYDPAFVRFLNSQDNSPYKGHLHGSNGHLSSHTYNRDT